MNGVGLTQTIVPASFHMQKRTRGVYGLRDPNTGKVRFIGQSEHIEKQFALQIASARAPDKCKLGSCMRFRRQWIRQLRSQGLRPELVVLKEILEGPLKGTQLQFIAIYEEFLGEADLNLVGTMPGQKNKWRKFIE